jgi:hypothetical protein
MKVLTEDQLIDTLISQHEIQVVDINKEISPDVKNILPRYLCYQYGALPLKKSGSNILKVAMVDPSDDSAIKAIEDYTGTAVDPGLAREHEINEGIKKSVPLTLKDLFNPQTINSFSKIASITALAAIIAIGIFTYKYVQTQRFGTFSKVAESTIYKNHDIMINVNSKTGLITLLGHGAYSDGHYSVSFKSSKELNTFVDKKKKDFSQDQYQWITWLLDNKLSVATKS